MNASHLLRGVDENGIIERPLNCSQCGYVLHHPCIDDTCSECDHPVKHSFFNDVINIDDDGHLCQDMYCVSCLYNLRTKRYDSQCPECGTDIEQSIVGHHMLWPDQKWIKKINRGFLAILLAQCALLVQFAPMGINPWISMLFPIFFCLGLWWVASPNPHADLSQNHRRVIGTLHILTVFYALNTLLHVGINLFGLFRFSFGSIWILIMQVSALLLWFVMLSYLCRTEHLAQFIKPGFLQRTIKVTKILLIAMMGLYLLFILDTWKATTYSSGNEEFILFLYGFTALVAYCLLMIITISTKRIYAQRIKLFVTLASNPASTMH